MNSTKRGVKRKMEPRISGDNICVEKPQDVKNQESPSPIPGTASGDSDSCTHLFHTFLCSDSKGPEHTELLKHTCELGDVWVHKYGVPLGSHTARKIKTGSHYYDTIIPDLESHGYKPLQMLARGRYGNVILAQQVRAQSVDVRECQPVAIKFINRRARKRFTTTTGGSANSKNKQEIPDEIILHEQLQHSNVVSVIETLNIQGRVGLVLEFSESGTMEQLLKMKDARFLTEPVARRYFKQIHNALQYVHSQSIAHLDICLQNILIARDDQVKLTDFGDARRCTCAEPACEDIVGSVGFQAPEIIKRVPYNPKLADLWSLGIVLYHLTVGRLPFGTSNRDILSKMERQLEYPLSKILPLSQQLRYILKGLLSFVPENRFSLIRTKNCEWFQHKDNRVQIGNFYLVRQPRKLCEGEQEAKLKSEVGI